MRPSDASEKCSSSDSEMEISKAAQTEVKDTVTVPNSCAPGSSSSTLLRGGDSSSVIVEFVEEEEKEQGRRSGLVSYCDGER